MKKTILARSIMAVFIIQLLVTYDVFAEKSIKTLLNEIKLAGSAQEKSKILRQLQEKSPVTTEDEVAVIDALDNSDLDVQETAVEIVSSAKIKNASGKLLQKVRDIPKIKVEKVSPEKEKEYRIKSLSALALSEMKDMKALPVIITLLGEAPSQAAYDENILAISAVNYGKDALKPVTKKIEEYGRRNPYGKMRLLSVVMNMKDRDAISDLKNMFDDSNDPDVKSAAARGLRNLGTPIEISKIINTLEQVESNPQRGKQWRETRLDLIKELGFSGNPEAIPMLKSNIDRELKRDRFNPSCYSETLALARIGGQESYQFLITIYNEHKNLQGDIIMAFGNGKMSEAIPFLIKLINDRNIDKQLRLYGTDSLGHITGEKEKYMKVRWEIESDKR
ncbi:MAG: HEAT repeat domain-containing protein [Nitrospiraceae bacterium]|nr:MAG: HEAT repeat domain-containing protein [Nitrospiraceae bacterium]